MAKDRARDPKRVPSLGISEPMSHVKLRNPAYGTTKEKYDSEGYTDAWRERARINYEENTREFNERNDAPIIKIDSSK